MDSLGDSLQNQAHVPKLGAPNIVAQDGLSPRCGRLCRRPAALVAVSCCFPGSRRGRSYLRITRMFWFHWIFLKSTVQLIFIGTSNDFLLFPKVAFFFILKRTVVTPQRLKKFC